MKIFTANSTCTVNRIMEVVVNGQTPHQRNFEFVPYEVNYISTFSICGRSFLAIDSS